MMNIYIKLLICLLTFIPLVSTSQVIDNKIIINASKVNLRLFPNDSSKIICQIIGGEEVTMVNSVGIQEKYHYQEINNYLGYWIEVKYKDKLGYVFSKYVIEDFAIFEEGQPLERIPMTKYFYGVYKTDLGDYLRPVSVTLKDELRLHFDDGDTIKIQAIRVIDRKDTSVMLICTNKLMNEGIIGDFTNFINKKTSDEHLEFIHLKAGDLQEIFCKFSRQGNKVYGRGIVYNLQAEGCFQMQRDNFVRGNSYRLFVTYNPNKDHVESIKQDITQFIPNIETFYSVQIVYFGDLDNDNRPDVILQTCQESGCADYILLSSSAHEGELLRLSSIRFHPNSC